MRARYAKTWSNVSAATLTADTFSLEGGAYVVDAVATWGGGSVALQRMGPNGTTWLSLGSSAALTADSVTDTLALPPGLYRLNAATASAIYATISRVPGE